MTKYYYIDNNRSLAQRELIIIQLSDSDIDWVAVFPSYDVKQLDCEYYRLDYIDMPPFAGHAPANHLWQRMPLAAIGVSIVAVIQAAPVFVLDSAQRQRADARHAHRSTAWVTHLADHLDTDVLPHLPEPFGDEYRRALAVDDRDPQSQLRLSAAMLYELAGVLQVTNTTVPEPITCLTIDIPMPLLPPILSCPRRACDGVLTRHRSGNTATTWLATTGTVTRAPVFTAQCSTCHTPVYPDRFQPSEAVGAVRDHEVLFRNTAVMRIGRTVYATRTLGTLLSKAVTVAHMPISTFGLWYSSICPDWRGQVMPGLKHDQLWRLFLLYHTLAYVGPNNEVSLPVDEDHDDTLVDACLALFFSVPTNPADDAAQADYRTYHIPGTSAHRCNECSHAHYAFRAEDKREEYTDDQLLLAHRNASSHPDRVVTAVVIDGIEKIGHKICAVDHCGRPLMDYREGRFCAQHIDYQNKCGVRGCLLDATGSYPACDEHRALYLQWESRFGRDRTLFENRRWIRRIAAIDGGEQRQEWEPVVAAWDGTIQHYWRARFVKVIEIAVTPCGVPLTWTKFPFAESETNISHFMRASWPQPHLRPTYLAIDKGCRVIASLHAAGLLFAPGTGWAFTTNIKVATFHYTSHAVDATCVELCNPNDRRDPNLVHLAAGGAPPQNANLNARGRGQRAQARRIRDGQEGYRRWFNFEAAEQLNSWLEPYSATMTKMKPRNHAVFLCILLRERAMLMMNNRDAAEDVE